MRAAAGRRIATIAAASAALPAADWRRLAGAAGLLDLLAADVRARSRAAQSEEGPDGA